MENRRDNSGLTRRNTPGDLGVDEIMKAKKGSTILGQDNTNSSTSWKATAQCQELGADSNLGPLNFNINDRSIWSKALPLFDGEDPTDGTQADFDEIVYTKLAQLNEIRNTKKTEKFGQTNETYAYRIHKFLKTAFNLTCLGIFSAILYAMYIEMY